MVPDRSTQPPPGSRESESRSVSGRLPSAEVVRVVVPSAHIPVSRGVFRFPGRGPGRSSAGMTAIRSTWLVVIHILFIFFASPFESPGPGNSENSNIDAWAVETYNDPVPFRFII